MKNKTITIKYTVSPERFKELQGAAKSWGHKNIPAYLKETIELHCGSIKGTKKPTPVGKKEKKT